MACALRLAEANGYQSVTRVQIAEDQGCSRGLVLHYFGETIALRDGIMRHAIAAGNLTVLAQGLAVSDPIALRAPKALKRQALARLAKASS